MSGWTSRLAHGLAGYLAANGVGTYRYDGSYRDEETGITIATVPAHPSRIIALTPYPISDDVSQGDSMVGLQIRCRSNGTDPRDALDLADTVFDVLAGTTHLNLDGVRVHLAERTASGSIGRDDNGRYEHVDTYRLTVHRPTRNRP